MPLDRPYASCQRVSGMAFQSRDRLVLLYLNTESLKLLLYGATYMYAMPCRHIHLKHRNPRPFLK